MQLNDIIIQKIRDDGPVSFHDFMEMCLYYPELGYYTAVHNTIGKQGDFYTSSYLTPAFGAMIARQLEEMWSILGEDKFTVVEYGAGTGMLCNDILTYLKNNSKLYKHLHYCIIEKSPAMREIEKATLTRSNLCEKVSWHNSIHDVPGITGCVLSNELVDNFSVHQVVMDNELKEVFVDYDNGFIEQLQPAGKALTDYLTEQDTILPEKFRCEINLEALKWINEISACLKKGYIITIDYGYSGAELYCDRHSQGTIVCYHNHSVNDCPYEHIGRQDITSHVNFSALDHWGMKSGLFSCGFTNQASFLLGLGLNEYLTQSMNHAKNFSDLKRNALLKYMLLIDMGDKYKVLIQQKEAPNQVLTGLKLSGM
jgi:SAM-dependent MidA family methyltransferase